jgi:hypothetical protein
MLEVLNVSDAQDLAGGVLRLPPTTHPAPMVELGDRMLLADPAAGPTIAETHAALMRSPLANGRPGRGGRG